MHVMRTKSAVDGVAQHATLRSMIISFKHKGLETFYRKGSIGGIQAKHRKKLQMQLAALDTAQVIEDVNIPGYRLHPLKGTRKGIWAISVSGNWRLTFQFKTGNIHILNYEETH